MRFGIHSSPAKKKGAVFSLHIEAVDCRYDIRVNDFPVDLHEEPTRLTVDIPVNGSVVTGENHLAAIVVPADRESEEFSPDARLAITVRESDEETDGARTVGGIVFQSVDLENEGQTGIETSPHQQDGHPARAEHVLEGMLLLERTFCLESAFPAWSWMKGHEIPDTPAVRARLVEEMQTFYRALKSKDVQTIRSLTRRKAREIGRAFHGGEDEGHSKIEFLDHVADPEMALLPFEESALELEIFGNGRLARLLTPEGFGPIAFGIRGHPVAAHMNVIYYLDESARWLQIR